MQPKLQATHRDRALRRFRPGIAGPLAQDCRESRYKGSAQDLRASLAILLVQVKKRSTGRPDWCVTTAQRAAYICWEPGDQLHLCGAVSGHEERRRSHQKGSGT